MIPRDILKRSSSVEVLPKFVVIKNARSASVAKDHRFSTKKDSLNIITLEPDDFNNFDDVQYKDVNIDEKESGKAVQIPQDDFTNTQGSSGGNEAFNYDDEDISQLLCNIDDNILFNLDEAESF
uniref:Uncharacterized protein n=1 Tax=Panagrolaimus superbus TaxID=310955 RepID=A0A914YGU8_9BILA